MERGFFQGFLFHGFFVHPFERSQSSSTIAKREASQPRGREWLMMQFRRQILVQRSDCRVDELEQSSRFLLFELAIDRGRYRLPAESWQRRNTESSSGAK